MATEVGLPTLVALIAFGALAWALYDDKDARRRERENTPFARGMRITDAERRIWEAETGKGSPEAWADLERSLRDEGKDKGPTES